MDYREKNDNCWLLLYFPLHGELKIVCRYKLPHIKEDFCQLGAFPNDRYKAILKINFLVKLNMDYREKNENFWLLLYFPLHGELKIVCRYKLPHIKEDFNQRGAFPNDRYNEAKKALDSGVGIETNQGNF